MSTKRNIITIQTLISKLGLRLYKADMVSGFTNGRTVHVSEMLDDEQVLLIEHLKEQEAIQDIVMDRMRKKVISKYREMNYSYFSQRSQKMVADMNGIQAHLKEHWGKSLNDYSKKELTKIISVLEEKFLPWYYEQQRKQNA